MGSGSEVCCGEDSGVEICTSLREFLIINDSGDWRYNSATQNLRIIDERRRVAGH
ncbi:MAG: hypothetical protein ABI837_02220 [Acidobacteriota bacterium]